MTETLIKKFTQISKADSEIAGGKGASLGEMTQAKIPVPEGFVILSKAFDRFIEETDLNVEIDAVFDTVDIKEIHTVENASEKIKGIILSKEIPEDIKVEILKFYKKLDCKFVAVRSSATSEDSASASWAGQLDSFLNTTEETLLENVKKCWTSLFTPRAIFYRFEKKLNKDKISVAVVVQKMVDSEESGIAFSVHPVTQDENQIIIEAGFGLGEAIVSGSITPDSYVVDKQGFSILDINVNEQTKALYKKAKGSNEWKELGEKGKKQVLTEEEIIELSKLIVKIENHYDFPVDVEWAKEKGNFYIVQSRPITTLKTKIENRLNEKEDDDSFEIVTRVINDVLTQYLVCEGGLKYWKKLTGLNFIYYFKEIDYTISYKKYCRKIFQQILRDNPKFFDKYFNLMKFEYEKYISWAENFKKDFTKSTLDELRKYINDFFEHYTRALSIIFLPFDMEKVLVEDISSKLPTDKKEDYLYIFSFPALPSESFEQQLDLLIIANIKNKAKIQTELKKHWKKYNWLGMLALRGEIYSLAHFENEVNQFKNPELLLSEKKLVFKKQQELIQKSLEPV